MDTLTREHPTVESLFIQLDRMLAEVAPLAAVWDLTPRFAAEGVEGLRRIGALVAPMPVDLGGLGLGTTPGGAAAICEMLRRIGRTSLALGRVFEGHVNALRLIDCYGTRLQASEAARDARDGHLFGIWAAENPREPACLADGVLTGAKSFASAAAFVSRGLVTVEVPDEGECLVLLRLDGEHGRAGHAVAIHGMRGAATSPFDVNGLSAAPHAMIGEAGDYMREPEISIGAWRTLAVQLGGLEALSEATMTALASRSRASDPHQSARLGRLLILTETVRLWVTRAAALGEGVEADGDDAAHYIRLARAAVESAILEAVQLAQRCVGLAGLAPPHPVERLTRDLATYLRQPALDEVVDQAAMHFLARPIP